jgi:murein L,D-transpeptidase YcbB/YkuD
MAGLIRFAVLNPYWNVPPDLARDRARRVLREGTGWIARERFEILSDWGDRPRVLKASQVNWRAVASGKTQLRMRQLPGGSNVMGGIKFMLPNDLGIYLHDFPDKSLFQRPVRNLSSGCIRVEDAPLLSRWLFGGKAPVPSGSRPEQRADLPEPVPVYISYFTALPDRRDGIAFQPDVYRRDGFAQLRTR